MLHRSYNAQIASRKRGLGEQDLIQLVQALVTSRIAHLAPYLNASHVEAEVFDWLIRKAYKQALMAPTLNGYFSP